MLWLVQLDIIFTLWARIYSYHLFWCLQSISTHHIAIWHANDIIKTIHYIANLILFFAFSINNWIFIFVLNIELFRMYWWATKRVKRFEIESQQSDVNKTQNKQLCVVWSCFITSPAVTQCVNPPTAWVSTFTSRMSLKSISFAKQTHFKVK